MTFTRFNFALKQHHKWSLTEIENLYPWERDFHLQMLNDHLESMEAQHGNGSGPRTDIPPELMMDG